MLLSWTLPALPPPPDQIAIVAAGKVRVFSFWPCPNQLRLDLPALLPQSDQITIAAAGKVGPVPCQISS